MRFAAAFSRAACAEVGCKSLGTLGALTDTPAELDKWCSPPRGLQQEGINEVDEIKAMIEAAKAEKRKLQKEYDLALKIFEDQKRRCDRQRRPVPHSVGREYLLSYDRFQVAEESLIRLESKLKSKRSPENLSGFQGHSTLR